MNFTKSINHSFVINTSNSSYSVPTSSTFNIVTPTVASQKPIPQLPHRHTPFILIEPSDHNINSLCDSRQTKTRSIQYSDAQQTRIDPSVIERITKMPSERLYRDLLTEIGKDAEFDTRATMQPWPYSNRAAVIVDPRYDTLMKGVIRNFMYHMNPKGWNLIIISYSGHAKRIMEDFPYCKFIPLNDANVTYNKTNGTYNIDVNEYNRIFKSKSFWEILPEKLTIFQKDCIMYKMFPDHFSEYYHYSGANFYNTQSRIYGGINGGFSIRNRDTMIECLENVNTSLSKNDIINAVYNHIDNEDVFFTHSCEKLGKLVPDKISRTFLAIEIDVNTETCAYHGWHHNYHDSNTALFLIFKSPFLMTYFRRIVDSLQ